MSIPHYFLSVNDHYAMRWGGNDSMTIRKRITRTAVVLVLLAGLCLAFAPMGQAVSVSDFSDISGSAWYYDAVSYVTGRGLFNGTSATAFSPNGTMTRGMFITVLGRYAGVDESSWRAAAITGSDVNLRSGPGTSYSVVTTMGKNSTVTLLGKSSGWYKVQYGSATGYVSADYVSPRYHVFSDVDYSSYYAGYAIWAYEKGVVNGMGSADVFAPNQNVTREQLCSLLNRYASTAGLTLSKSAGAVTFTDESSISSWAKSDVSAMQRSGVVNGSTDGAFHPGNSATRAEAAAMFQRFDIAAGQPKPPTTPAPTATPSPTPKPTDPPSTGDSPATFIDGTVSVKSDVIRVGLLVSTRSISTCVTSVTLKNTNGTGFEYGSMGSDRRFSSAGSIGDTTVTITTDGSTFTVKDSAGNVVYTSGTTFAIHPTGSGKTLTSVNGEYRYYGDFELRQAYYKSGYITVINCVNIEDYVKGVIPYEFSTSWPTETLKAAAIVSRSYAMSYDWRIYGQYGIDIICNDGSQTYRGRGISYSDSYFASTDAAVDATAGAYLTYNGNVCVTVYSAADGGATKSSSEVFGTNYAYLKGKTDPYEQSAVKDAGSGYSQSVKNSHKVGLSQWGAYAMAKYYGMNYQDILGFYYTGAHLQYGAY